jgi:hypothetical protein
VEACPSGPVQFKKWDGSSRRNCLFPTGLIKKGAMISLPPNSAISFVFLPLNKRFLMAHGPVIGYPGERGATGAIREADVC